MAAFGIEMNPAAAAAAERRGATVYRGLMEELDDLPCGTFDLVTSWDSIQHAPHPRAFAGRLAALARPGDGKVIVTTLNMRSLVAQAAKYAMADDCDETFYLLDETHSSGCLRMPALF